MGVCFQMKEFCVSHFKIPNGSDEVVGRLLTLLNNNLGGAAPFIGEVQVGRHVGKQVIVHQVELLLLNKSHSFFGLVEQVVLQVAVVKNTFLPKEFAPVIIGLQKLMELKLPLLHGSAKAHNTA